MTSFPVKRGFVGSAGQASVGFPCAFASSNASTESPFGEPAGISAISDANAGLNQVLETALNGTAVGITAFASHAGHTVTYALDDDAGGLFAIDASTGVVTKSGALDAETAQSHSITVRADSSSGDSSTETFTIAILDDASESAVGTISDVNTAANEVSESAATGTEVGITASAADADITDTVTYSLDDSVGGRFAIDATTGVVTVADTGLIDFETATDHTITVRATSSDGSTGTATFTIDVLNDAADDGLAQAVRFDGTSDSMARAADPTGAADGEFVTLAIPIKIMGGDATLQYIWSNATGSYIRRNANGTVEAEFADSVGASVVNMLSTATLQVSDGWQLLFVTPAAMYLGDTDITGTRTPGAATDIDFTAAFYWGRDSAGGNLLNAELARPWMALETLDISLQVQRDKFASSFSPLTLADIKTDGSGPTGTQALDFFPNGFSDFEVNSGSGGNFVMTGGTTEGTGPDAAALTEPVEPVSSFPIVEGTATTIDNNALTSKSVTLPSGITPGDLLVVIFTNGSSITTPPDWHEEYAFGSNGPSPPATRVWVRVADGSEGSALSVTGGAGRATAISYRVSGAHNVASEAVEVADNRIDSLSNDLPSLSPSWGSAKTLWLAQSVIRSGTRSTTATPADFTDKIEITNNSIFGTRQSHASMRRELEAASVDPGTYTWTDLGVTDNWHNGLTIAIRPAA